MGARLAGLASGLCLLLGFSGCVSVLAESASQRDEIGDVEVVTVVCAGGTTTSPSDGSEPQTCSTGNSGRAAGTGDYQLMVAYRVPLGVSFPEAVGASEGTIALIYNSGLVAELNRLAPIAPAAGQRWIGYLSPSFHYGPPDDTASATLHARFGLIRPSSGLPWSGPFRYRTLVGYRDAAPDPSRPVQCGPSLAEYSEDGTTLCMDSPSAAESAADYSVPTRDLGVLATTRAKVTRGAAADAGFSVVYAGGRAGPNFVLSASTSVPGGTAVPAVSSLTPGAAGSTPVKVRVSAPASVTPGDYDVTLVAALPNGQRRSSTAIVAVTGPSVVDRRAPEVNLRLHRLPRIARARKVGIAPEIACSESCRLEADLRIGRVQAKRLGIGVPRKRRFVRIGVARERRMAAGRRSLRVRFSRRLAPRIGRASRVTMTYRVVARDRAGNFRVRKARFSLKR